LNEILFATGAAVKLVRRHRRQSTRNTDALRSGSRRLNRQSPGMTERPSRPS
jgi:hypothetical protein